MKYPIISFILLCILALGCRTSEDDMQVMNNNNNTPQDTLTTPDTLAANPFLIKPGTRTQVVAHRGGRDLAPENTLVAFDNAVSLDVDVLEMDVALTKDSILVTIHDLTIDRTSDSTGNVIDFTFQELQQFNFGYQFEDDNGDYPFRANPVRIPRLEEIFEQHPTELMMIEVKDQGATGKAAARILNEAIEAYNLQKQVAVFSFTDEVKLLFPAIFHDDICIGASLGDAFEFVGAVSTGNDALISSMALDVFALPMDAIGIDLTTDSLIEAAHRNGKAVHYWTIDNKNDMELLINRGADGIMTDKPDLLIETLDELGF